MTHQPELIPDQPTPEQTAREAGRAEYPGPAGASARPLLSLSDRLVTCVRFPSAR
jgi:hypothetical protein